MSLSRTSSPQQTRAQKHRSQLSTSSSAQPPNARMSPASRYHSNLKVLRRRDPSIISIFDQFSHVCVYHHNGKKWEKQGYEGSMFLFERESYPPYGFYILNRVGMDDYVQRLYPEDDITAHSGYVMLRSYPNFTAARLDTIQQKLSSPPPEKFSDIYAYTEASSSTEKGESQTIGLWTFSTDGSESLQHVLPRLHSYIKKNAPYPEHYRYGPERPPPVNPYNRTNTSALTEGDPEHSDFQASIPTAPTNGLSDLDKLFAKFLPQPLPNTQATASTTSAPTSSSSMSLQSLFAGAGNSLTYPNAHLPGALPSPPPPPPSTGIGLLDTLFASAAAPTQPGSNPLQQQQPLAPPAPSSSSYLHPSTAPHNAIPTHLLTPKSKALPPPQVLSPNVIASYSGSSLGIDVIDGPGVESISHSPSHPSSRDGDNEDDSHAGSSSDGSGGGGGGLGAIAAHALGRSVPIQIRAPLNQPPPPPQHQFSDSALKNLGMGTGQGLSTHGDATPRQTFLNNQHVQNLAPATSSAKAKATTAPSGRTNEETKPRDGRPLIPFEPNSELWPYPRQQLEGASGEDERGGGENDIVELDWEDMSALSDPAAFLRVQKRQQKLRPPTGGMNKQNGTTTVPPPPGREDSTTPTTTQGKKKKEKKKNVSKQERLEAIARERKAIEQSWDFPTQEELDANFGGSGITADIGNGSNVKVKENGAGMMMNLNGKFVPVPVTFSEDSPPASPSPPPTEIPSSQGQSHTTAAAAGGDEEISVSGESSGVNGSVKKKKRNRRKMKKPVTVGDDTGVIEVEQQLPPDTTTMGPVHHEKVLSTLLTSLSEQPEHRRPTAHERNKFVREVLTLIQTDPDFANTLWRRYYSQSQSA